MVVDRLQVKQEKIKVLTVTVVKAKHIKVDEFIAWEIPDPYVILRVQTSPNGKQRTKVKLDKYNPVWNESFTFYLNHDKKNILEITVKDKDILTRDDMVGAQKLELDNLEMNTVIPKTVKINEVTTLELNLFVQYDETKELRLSYDLCEEERQFLQKRREEILKNMPKFFDGDKAARNLDEVPVIGIMGSGGGYRAACGLSGVFCALQEAGILDCSTYVTGLSGSSWYISTLYTHEGWPGIKCQTMADELKEKFDTSIWDHFKVHFIKYVNEKGRAGQPVRLTDFFGLFIGDCLLNNQKSKLSYQTYKVKWGEVPLPITTGIRVRLDQPAAEFSEWVEFTPFEYGMAKYGVFGKTREFGGKYYKGRLVKKFEESPLHYLQGIWGSAFSIILSTLLDKDKHLSEREAEKELEKVVHEEAARIKTEDDDSDDEDEPDGLPEDEIKDESWLANALNPINLITSRRGKAAEVFNVLRGLEFKSENDGEYHEALGNQKTMCLVDSGIAFNSPFPTLLRPERKVEIILSFDFSQRDGGDKELPFSNLLKAERWAKEHGLPFPQIEGNPILKNPVVEEFYVFEDLTKPACPTVLHFPLTNKTFRDFSAPGVPRVKQEDKEFGNFDIFDDPDKPYSSFNFHYKPRNFERLHELMKYNTLAHMDVIKEKIGYQVNFRRNNPAYVGR